MVRTGEASPWSGWNFPLEEIRKDGERGGGVRSIRGADGFKQESMSSRSSDDIPSYEVG